MRFDPIRSHSVQFQFVVLAFEGYSSIHRLLAFKYEQSLRMPVRIFADGEVVPFI
jgi:hypothetical protein